MSALELRLHCTACNSRFERTWEPKDGQIRCPSCGAPTCPCGCGGDLGRNRAGALYYADACHKRVQRSNNADISRTGLRSGNVRSVEEAGALHDIYKGDWERRIIRRIKSALDTKGEYHADDCADLPVPAAHVNLIGVQVMRLKNRGIVLKVEDRRNSSKASNSRPSGVYRYAKGGPQKLAELAGLDTDQQRDSRVDRRENPTVGVQSGDSTVGAGQANGKGDQGRLIPVEFRVISKIDFTKDDCWWWTGSTTGSGYGQITVGETTRVAHRVVYELLVGRIPEDLEPDHLCRNRRCVNPAHLEPVTHSVNVERASKPEPLTHCQHGHPFDETNTIVRRNGRRACRECKRARERSSVGAAGTDSSDHDQIHAGVLPSSSPYSSENPFA